MKELMALLAKNWVAGYISITVVCIAIYLTYSILLIRSCRKIGYDVGMSGMIPVWNILVLFIRCVKGIKYKKSLKVKPSAKEELFEI